MIDLVKAYFKQCGWQLNELNQNNGVTEALIRSENESYLCLIYDDPNGISRDSVIEAMQTLDNHDESTTTTLLFAGSFQDGIDDLKYFSTCFYDSEALQHLENLRANIPSYQHIQLHAHNQLSYERYRESNELRSAFVQATGTGKAYLIARIAQDVYPGKIQLYAPNNFIIEQQQRLISDSIEVDYITYQYAALNTETLTVDADTSLIVLDEFHRLGAEKWGPSLLDAIEHSDVKVLGTSATPVRYLDDERNMADELFDNHLLSNISLTNAIARGILPQPDYITCLYQVNEIKAQYQTRIQNSNADAKQKKDCLDTLNGLTMDWEKVAGVPAVFQNALPSLTGKFIVFCSAIEQIEPLKALIQDWVNKAAETTQNKQVNLTELELHTGIPNSERDAQLTAFENGEDTSLTLLYTVDMLNEGKHVEDIDGVILLRKTVSPQVFYQQIGRAFSSGQANIPLIIDLVGNLSSIHSQLFKEDLEREMTSLGGGSTQNSKTYTGRIVDFTKGLSDKLIEIDDWLDTHNDFNTKLTQLIEYGKRGIVPSQDSNDPEEKRIARFFKHLKTKHKNGRLDQRIVDQLTEIGISLETKENKSFDSKLTKLIEYGKQGVTPSRYNNDPEEKSIGNFFYRLKTKHKNGQLDQRIVDQLTEAGFTFESREEREQNIFNEKLAKLVEYGKQGIVPSQDSNDPEEKRIASFFYRLKTKHKNGRLDQRIVDQLTKAGFTFESREEREQNIFNEKLAKLVEYGKQGKRPSQISKDPEERIIANFSQTLRKKYREGHLDKAIVDQLSMVGIELLSQQEIFNEKLAKLIEYGKEGKLPSQHTGDSKEKSVASFLYNLKVKYRDAQLDQRIVDQLTKAGVSLEMRHQDDFDTKLIKLVEYGKEGKTLSKKSKDPEEKRIASFYTHLKTKHKNGRLDQRIVDQLTEAGVSLETTKPRTNNDDGPGM